MIRSKQAIINIVALKNKATQEKAKFFMCVLSLISILYKCAAVTASEATNKIENNTLICSNFSQTYTDLFNRLPNDLLTFERLFAIHSIFGANNTSDMSEWKLDRISHTYSKEGTDKLIHIEWNGSEIVHATDNEGISEKDFAILYEDFKTRMNAASNVSVA